MSHREEWMITITRSPYIQDYADEEEAPPWTYSELGFQNWVWEVLLNLGEIGPYPKSIGEAIEIAEANGYEVVGQEDALLDMDLKYALPDRSWSPVMHVQIPVRDQKEKEKKYWKRVQRFLKSRHPELQGTIANVCVEPGYWK